MYPFDVTFYCIKIYYRDYDINNYNYFKIKLKIFKSGPCNPFLSNFWTTKLDYRETVPQNISLTPMDPGVNEHETVSTFCSWTCHGTCTKEERERVGATGITSKSLAGSGEDPRGKDPFPLIGSVGST